MTTRAIVLALSLLLAGCLAKDEAPVDAAATQADVGPDLAANVTADAANATATPTLTPVAYSGTTPVGACAFLVGQCQFIATGTEDYHLIQTEGQPVRLLLSIAYGAQQPGMSFYAALCEGENEGETCTEYVTGPSPLVLDYDLSAHAPGTLLGISVGSVNVDAAAAGTMLFGESTFDVTGTLTTA